MKISLSYFFVCFFCKLFIHSSSLMVVLKHVIRSRLKRLTCRLDGTFCPDAAEQDQSACSGHIFHMVRVEKCNFTFLLLRRKSCNCIPMLKALTTKDALMHFPVSDSHSQLKFDTCLRCFDMICDTRRRPVLPNPGEQSDAGTDRYS
jgi:hypothetical protein